MFIVVSAYFKCQYKQEERTSCFVCMYVYVYTYTFILFILDCCIFRFASKQSKFLLFLRNLKKKTFKTHRSLIDDKTPKKRICVRGAFKNTKQLKMKIRTV